MMIIINPLNQNVQDVLHVLHVQDVQKKNVPRSLLPPPVPHGHHDPHVPPSGNCQNGPVNKKNKKKCEQEYGGTVNCLKDNDWYFWCEGGNHNLSVTDINGVTNCTCS